MKKRRIFISLSLPDDIKKRLLLNRREWPDLPAKWTIKPNLHITLVFIGYVWDEDMLEVCKISKQIAKKYEPIEINLNQICLAPPGKAPRMVWVMGPKNERLTLLKKDLEKNIFDSPDVDCPEIDNRPFSPHITLARIDHKKWRQLNPKPEIMKNIKLSFYADFLEVMQSNLSRSGAEYVVLESAELKG